MPQVIKTFFISYIIANIIASICWFILLTYDINPGPTVLIAGLLYGASFSGKKYIKIFDEAPSSRISWKFALHTLPITILTGILLLFFILYFDPNASSIFLELTILSLSTAIILLFLIISLIHIFTIRFCFRILANHALKKQEK